MPDLTRHLRAWSFRAWLVAIALGMSACAGSPAATPDASVPEPNPSQGPKLYSGPPDQYFAQLADCIRDAGFSAEVSADGSSMSFDYGTVEQRPAYEAAKAACDAEIGLPLPPEPLSEPQIRERYAFLVEARTCLIAQGYDLPEPPTEDVFVETYGSDPWSPFSDVPVMDQEAWEALTAICPQT